MEELKNFNDALDGMYFGSTFDETDGLNLSARAEDIAETGIDFSKHFFEPEVGKSYTIKLLPNFDMVNGKLLFDNPIVHRQIYKSLPDPKRKGKKFQYISKGKDCPVLNLFFELNSLKKNNDFIAEKKIEKYLSKTNQICVKVQILSSPNKEDIGNIRLFVVSSFGPNATIANLINEKINPTKEKLDAGFEREDIFALTETSVLFLDVTEATYDGRKGRDYTKSAWSPKKMGAISILPDGKQHQFKSTDFEDKVLDNGKTVKVPKQDVIEFYKNMLVNISNSDYSIFKMFQYKDENDTRLDEETRSYVKLVNEKVNEIIPIIRDNNLNEIELYCKSETSTEKKETTSIHEEAIPDELKGIMGGDTHMEEPTKPTKNSSNDADVESILNS